MRNELKAQGATDPIEQAISSLGEPTVLAAAFIAEAQTNEFDPRCRAG
jgi:hypothetical protein